MERYSIHWCKPPLGFSEAEMALSDVMIANGGSDDELVMAYIRLQMAKEMLPETLSPFRSILAHLAS